MTLSRSLSTLEVDELCINTLRFLAVDMVQKANSGHPGLPMGAASMAYTLWDRSLKFNKPSLIQVHTHIGFGSPHKQDSAAAHGKPIGPEEVRLSKVASELEVGHSTINNRPTKQLEMAGIP